MLGQFKQDVRHTLRQWRQARGFVLTAVLTLALGIGATTAIFTLVDAVLLQALPVNKPQQLYRVGDNPYSGVVSGLPNNFGVFSYDQYKYFRDNTPEFQELAACQSDPRRIGVRRGESTIPAQAEIAEYVSGNYFSTLGVKSFAGRVLSVSDDDPGSSPVAVMSYSTWQHKYAGDRTMIGSSLSMNRVPVTVVGIAPPGFYGDTLSSTPPDLWISILSERSIDKASALVDQPQMLWLNILGRSQGSANPEQIEARMKVELQQWLTRQDAGMTEAERLQIPRLTLHIVSAQAGIGSAKAMRTSYQTGLKLLMIISSLVLLIVCANIANLVLVRALQRSRQTAINVALGAPRSRLIAQALTENVLLAVAGGACGLAVAFGGTRAILDIMFSGSSGIPVSASPSMSVLLFAAAVSVATGALFGIVPAWIGSAADPIDALRLSGRSTSGAGGLPQRTLVVLQAALSLALLTASGLLLQTLKNLEQQHFGFDTNGRVAARVDTFLAGYKPEQLPQISDRIRDRLKRLPGVERVSEALYGPLSGAQWQGTVFVDGQPPPPPDSTENDCPFDRVGPGYFQTIGTRLIDGREISEQDAPTSKHVAVVNQSFARRFFGSENPIGRHFGKDGGKYTADYEIVGVVEDAKYFSPQETAPAMFFLPLRQATKYDDMPSQDRLEIRSQYPGEFDLTLAPGARVTEGDVRNAFADVDPAIPVVAVQSLTEQAGRTLKQQKLLARLTLVFGLTALLLVSLGTYGVTAHRVQARTREIGIRMALGASRTNVLSLIAGDAFLLVGIGAAIGLPLCMMSGRLLSNRLYGVNAFDLHIIAWAAVALALSAAAAVVVPAGRAVLTPPISALRTT